jgi:hypothetical protein
MNSYDPERAPRAADWLALDEGQRLEIVTAFHRQPDHVVPNARVHATFHVIVENQLALGVSVVADTLSRLQRDGLTRHDAIHAIGSVLATEIFDALKGHATPEDGDPNTRYATQLKELTAARWKTAG